MPESDPDLREMNLRWAVVKFGGKTKVMETLEGKALEFLSVQCFRDFYLNRLKLTDQGKLIKLAAWWLNHFHRRTYNNIDFVPGGSRVLDGGVFNTWSGW